VKNADRHPPHSFLVMKTAFQLLTFKVNKIKNIKTKKSLSVFKAVDSLFSF
jgi:hypothetical protein